MAVLVHAREDELPELGELEAEIARFTPLERLDERGVHELCPLLRAGEGGAVAGIADRNGIRLDPHALLQGFLRQLRSRGGELCTSSRATAIEYRSGVWNVRTESGDGYSAPILVNAAGSWADRVAVMAGTHPLGLEPKRRTIITFDAPPGTDLDRLPFAKTVGDELYFAPESGRLFASPMDEVPSDPCDAQPEEMEIALAAFRMEERTNVKVGHIHSKWSGLRTFTPDRHPAVDFAIDANGFFWLAGQGGFGLQTSPAMAAIVESLIVGTPWPVPEIAPAELLADRFVP
jgi:D-arginine dehydrogenase